MWSYVTSSILLIHVVFSCKSELNNVLNTLFMNLCLLDVQTALNRLLVLHIVLVCVHGNAFVLAD